MPEIEARLGVAYDTRKFSCSVFDSARSAYHDVRIREAGNPDIHPPAKSYHDISLNLKLRFHEILEWKNDRALTLDFHVSNLVGDIAYIPILSTGLGANTYPTDGGRFFSLKLRYDFYPPNPSTGLPASIQFSMIAN